MSLANAAEKLQKPGCQFPENVDARAKTHSLKNTSWFFAYSRAYFLNALSLTRV